MSKELIERLREVDPYEDVNTGLCHDAADLIEAQQSWIASLEQNARDADRMYKELETELAEAQKRIDELERSLKSEERLSFRHQLEESQAREALQQKRIDDLRRELAALKSGFDAERKVADKSEREAFDLGRQLAASQAQIKVLRDALEKIKDTRVIPATIYGIAHKALAQPTDDSALRELLKAEREAILELRNHEDVLAPVGQSAWGEAYQDRWIAGERLAELVAAAERERCAKVCDSRILNDHSREDVEARNCAKAIRAIKDQ